MKTNQSLHSTVIIRCVLFVATFLSIQFASTPMAQAQKSGALIINPKRLVFEGNKKNDVLALINTGTDSATYLISTQEMKMDDNGDIRDMDTEANPLSSAKLIRFFPKQVTLGPKETQTIRVQLLKPSTLAANEYRSYLYIRPTKREKALSSLPDTGRNLHMSVATVFGLAVPVIVRNNTQPAAVIMGGLKMAFDSATKLPAVKGTLFRSGNQSVYGTLVAKFVPTKGEETVLSIAKGVAVYVPNQLRNFQLPLVLPKGVTLSKGKVVVIFQTFTDAAKETVLASAEVGLN